MTDLLRFAAFHLGPGQPLLRPEAMTALLDPSRLRAGAPRQAMAWRAAPLQGTTVLEVGGSTTAQCGLMVLVPDHRFAMVAMANSGTGAALLQRIKTAALKEFCALTTGKQRTPAATNRAEACTGHYRNPTHDLELHFDGSQLTVQVTFKRGGFPFDTFDEVRQVPALPCTLYDDDRLAVLPDTPFERTGGVVRNEHGGIDWVLLHGRAHRRTEY